ncbi:aromatic amino acid lyase [Candidatus Kaiserbacteria bacterium]|nr:aromatic amino acid lyase [Candidatus Kaiserbacteria bacterium]
MKNVTISRTKRPTQKRTLAIDGSSLTTTDIAAFVGQPDMTVSLSPQTLRRMKAHRDFLLGAAQTQAIYGVNTGFGPMVTHIISAQEITALQYNLLRGHAVGMGTPIDSRFVLSAMIVRLNTLAKGFSAASSALAQTLAACINARITPIVPEHGAVGTSGDLVQLAHIALMLIGEGEVMYWGKRQPALRALKKAGITPHTLGPKEGLCLINGTSVMSGIGALLLVETSRALAIATRAGALAFELMKGFTDVIDPTLHAARPHEGQERIARAMRDLTRNSKLLSNRQKVLAKVEINDSTHVTDILLQEVYSLRCIPQVLGPVLETLWKSEGTVYTEINSVTDNPIVDLESKRFLHGGNFHGDYVATALDQMKAGLIKMTLMSERRINLFLNKNINHTFTPFLNLKTPGLTIGLQGLQFVATSTAADSQSLGYPHSLHSISTNGDNQDIVSMGTDAALFAAKVLDNAFVVLAIELVALSQAVAVLDVESKLSPASRALVEKVRTSVKPIIDDRSLTSELEALRTALRYDESLDIAW